MLFAEVEMQAVSSLQAPQPLWPALKEAGQTAQACASRTTVNPVWEDFTATLLASLNPQDPAEGGKPDSQETNIICALVIIYFKLTSKCLPALFYSCFVVSYADITVWREPSHPPLLMELQGDHVLRVPTAQREQFNLCPVIQGRMLL